MRPVLGLPFIALFTSPSAAWAAGLRISDVHTRTCGVAAVLGTPPIQGGPSLQACARFDIAWSGSWSDPRSHDAAWVFLKYRAILVDLQAAPVYQMAWTEADTVGLPERLVQEMIDDPDLEASDSLQIQEVQKGLWTLQDTAVTNTAGGLRKVEAVGYVAAYRPAEQVVNVRASTTTPWAHGSIQPDPVGKDADHRVLATADRRGVFVASGPALRSKEACQQDALSTDRSRARCHLGDVAFEDIELRWQPSAAHAEAAGRTEGTLPVAFDVWVQGVEMVHVSPGPFWVGDPSCDAGHGPSGCIYDKDAGAGAHQIHDESPVPVNAPGGIAYRLQGGSGDLAGPIPAPWPKATQGYYMMKYELSQGEYAQFINTLHLDQKTHRYPGAVGHARYEIQRDSTGERVALRPDRAVNWVGWVDAAAWLDWAGLRPFTEFEFTKACRGDQQPLAGEFCWGSVQAFPVGIIVGSEAPGGTANLNGNLTAAAAEYVGGDHGEGPVDGHAFELDDPAQLDLLVPPGQASMGLVGVASGATALTAEDLARTPPTDIMRQLEGRGHSGALQLSGNLWEFAVSMGNPAGRAFNGCHGDGTLTPGGEANVNTWPDKIGEGLGFRGGAWYPGIERAKIAHRHYGAESYFLRSHDAGIRGVRTAPGGQMPDTLGADCQVE